MGFADDEDAMVWFGPRNGSACMMGANYNILSGLHITGIGARLVGSAGYETKKHVV